MEITITKSVLYFKGYFCSIIFFLLNVNKCAKHPLYHLGISNANIILPLTIQLIISLCSIYCINIVSDTIIGLC